MAFEFKATPPWTAYWATTGRARARFVTINSSGKCDYPAVGARVVGVALNSSTASTKAKQACSILSYGIARVEAKGGALAQGQAVAATSQGKASSYAKTVGTVSVGFCVSGTTGTTGRYVSVLLYPTGASTV